MVKIYTKTGDLGETSLLNGTRVSKAHDRVEAYGTLDELNAYIGWIRDMETDPGHREILLRIQNNLFAAEARIAADPGKPVKDLPHLPEEEIMLLEQEIDAMTSSLPPLKHFILPGGHPQVSRIHIARTVCRRAERCLVRLGKSSEVPPVVVRYLNRLSDFFFVLARKTGVDLKAGEVNWPGEKTPDR